MAGPVSETNDLPCAWRGGNDFMECPVCGQEYDYRKEPCPPCGLVKWRPLPSPRGEVVKVRGGDGREHLYRDGVIIGSDAVAAMPREWRWLVEEIDV